MSALLSLLDFFSLLSLSLFSLFSLLSLSPSFFFPLLSDLSLLRLSLSLSRDFSEYFDLDDLDLDFDRDLRDFDFERLLRERDLLLRRGDDRFFERSFDLDRERLDLDLRDLELDRCRPRELLLRREGDFRRRSFERERLECDRDLRRCRERDRLCLERDRFRDLERRLRPLDRDRDFLLREPLLLRLSFDSMPIIGSIAADIKLCASLTRDIASSISFCAASLLFASGFAIAWVEWQSFIGFSASILPFSCRADTTLDCSDSSRRA